MSGLLDSLGLGLRVPETLAFRPEPLWIGDAAAARRLMEGRFRFAGEEVQARDLGPWRIPPPSDAFADALHGFAWLDDLAAAGTREARRVAQSWLFGWIAQFGDGAGPGWGPETAGIRATAWMERADFVLRDASADLERRFLRALALHERRLKKGMETAPEGLARIRAAAGHLNCVLALHSDEAPRRAAARRLAAAASLAVDEAGGLNSRAPERLCEALIALAAAARHLSAAGLDPEPDHAAAIARAQGALRALRMRDGGLPRFHGGGAGAPGRLDHALSLVHARKPAAARERAMGFVRLSAGRATVVVDAARPPATPSAHAATLGFELAFGALRPIVNCGPAGIASGDWAAACRATAAQSTLSLEGVSSARIGPNARGPGPHPFGEGPRVVEAETAQDGDGSWFLGSHDGYLGSHGLVHHRRLFLSHDGRDFRGEDVLESPDDAARRRFERASKTGADRGLAFAAHFHLHPSVEAAARADGTVTLTIERTAWVFSVIGGEARVRDSVYFEADQTAPRATKQVVVSARAVEYGGRVSWGLRLGDPA